MIKNLRMQYVGMYELQYHRRPVNLDLTLSIAADELLEIVNEVHKD